MANHEQPEHDPVPIPPERIDRIERIEKSLVHRIKALEDSVSKMRDSHLESHKWFITFVFGAVAIFITVTANQSKTDVREDLKDMRSQLHDSISDMQTQVNKAIGDLNQNFKELAGNALKKPVLTISNNRGLLDGQTITLASGQLPLLPLYIHNIGDKETSPLIIQIYTASDLYVQGGGGLLPAASNDKDYPNCYFLELYGQVVVYPQETTPLSAQNMYDFRMSPTTSPIKCKLLIFYGADKPAEADFQIKYP